jgi:16S rRNA (adenine1518-N6/adenine1519-N6)-dimethyltransferase
MNESSIKHKILNRLRDIEGSPKRSLGQNFLVSSYIIEKIVDWVQSKKISYWIELGPGLGSLTDRLLAKIDCDGELIELDRKLVHYWKSRNLKVTEIDALKLDWNLLNLPKDTILVSNLPYQISASIVIDRSFSPKTITEMVLMFQKEVAQRITSEPNLKSYGLLSVIAQLHWNIERVVDVGPQCFYPAPNVHSRVLSFRRKPDIEIDSKFLSFVKSGFSYRRKLLKKNLTMAYTDLSLKKVIESLEEMGFKETARAENLSPEDFLELYERLLCHGRN